MVYDRSELVDATLRTVGKNLAEGGLLVHSSCCSRWAALRAGLLVAALDPGGHARATAAAWCCSASPATS
jgi:cobalt-zinc-cadmium resistance protein CzcA